MIRFILIKMSSLVVYKQFKYIGIFYRVFVVIVALTALSACSAPVARGEFNDPYEASSRKVHAFNKGFDKAIFNPSAKGYVAITPPLVVRMVSNFAGFIGLGGQAVNNVLQADAKGFGETALRFAVNALTFGLGDLATEAGIPDNNADFGQTLYVWNVKQGVYHEIPLLGPSTTRDTVGFFVDLAINPLNIADAPNARWAGVGLFVLDRLGDRSQYSAFYDEMLYNSEDSYATARNIYLQNRNFFLNKGVVEDTLEDPFANFE
jgi:phospholipid-binding lipoprotein MlaA